MQKPKVGKNVMDFLREFRVISFAIAFVLGMSINDLIQSFVNNLLMPLIDPLIVDGTWKTAVWNIGPFSIGWGLFLGKVVNFALLLLIVYIVIKKLLKYHPLPGK